jgi:hypothetical protein
MVAHTYNPSYTGGREQEDCGLRPVCAKMWDPIREISKGKWAVNLAQVVESLPSKHEALCSNSNTAKQKKDTWVTYAYSPGSSKIVFDHITSYLN